MFLTLKIVKFATTQCEGIHYENHKTIGALMF